MLQAYLRFLLQGLKYHVTHPNLPVIWSPAAMVWPLGGRDFVLFISVSPLFSLMKNLTDNRCLLDSYNVLTV